jgi:hypothetical protein
MMGDRISDIRPPRAARRALTVRIALPGAGRPRNRTTRLDAARWARQHPSDLKRVETPRPREGARLDVIGGTLTAERLE